MKSAEKSFRRRRGVGIKTASVVPLHLNIWKILCSVGLCTSPLFAIELTYDFHSLQVPSNSKMLGLSDLPLRRWPCVPSLVIGLNC